VDDFVRGVSQVPKVTLYHFVNAPSRFCPDDIDDAMHFSVVAKRHSDACQAVSGLLPIGATDKARVAEAISPPA